MGYFAMWATVITVYQLEDIQLTQRPAHRNRPQLHWRCSRLTLVWVELFPILACLILIIVIGIMKFRTIIENYSSSVHQQYL